MSVLLNFTFSDIFRTCKVLAAVYVSIVIISLSSSMLSPAALTDD